MGSIRPIKIQPQQCDKFPEDLLRVEGLLGQFMAECDRSAPERRQPVYALAAALCTVGALAGRRYRNYTDLRTNVYCAILGESSSGKGHAQRVALRLFADSGLSDYICGQYQSGNALLQELVQNPAKLSIVDEFGIWITGLTGERTPKYLSDIKKSLMTLFSSAGDLVKGPSYADPKIRERKDIYQPHLCFLGVGTPEHFFSALQTGALKDGFIPRFLVFRPDEFYPTLVEHPEPLRISQDMIEAAQKIAGTWPGYGDLAGLNVMASDKEFDAALVPFTDDGQAEHDRQRARREAIIQGGCEGFVSKELVGKWGEHAIKLGLIRAISRDPANPVLDQVCVSWGWRLAEYCVRTMSLMAGRHIADTPTALAENRIVNFVRDQGGSASLTAIGNAVRMKPRDRREVIADLVERGQLREERRPGVTPKPMLVYHLPAVH